MGTRGNLKGNKGTRTPPKRPSGFGSSSPDALYHWPAYINLNHVEKYVCKCYACKVVFCRIQCLTDPCIFASVCCIQNEYNRLAEIQASWIFD